MFPENFPLKLKFGTTWANEITADKEEWSELPIGATTVIRTRSGTSVIRRSRVPPRARVGPTTNRSQEETVYASKSVTPWRFVCGICHMAFSFMLLPRVATTTLCSTELLLAALLQASSYAATTLLLFSDLCTSTNPIRCNSYSLRTTAFLLLDKPPENSGTYYYARNQVLAKINIDKTQHISPKVLAPRQGCSTTHKRIWRTNDSSSASFDHQSWCPSHNLRPVTKSTLCKTFLMKTSQLSHAYQVTQKLWWKLCYRDVILATNNINYTRCTSPKVPVPYSGCPAKSRRTLN